MKIIQIEPRANGGRAPIQSWGGSTCPDGYALIQDDFDISVFTASRGFVNIEVKDGYCTSMAVNQAALDAYLAQNPDPDPKIAEYQAEIDELKQALADSDYKAIKYAEGEISEEDYAPIKAQRQAWRDRINELEALISG